MMTDPDIFSNGARVALTLPNVKRLVVAGEWKIRGVGRNSRAYVRVTRLELEWILTMRQIVDEVMDERATAVRKANGIASNKEYV